MAKRKPRPYDRIFIGWIIGMIFPLTVFLMFYRINYSHVNLFDFVKSIWQMRILMKLLSICVFPNLGFFFVFYRLKYDMAARGVILATFLFAFAVLLTKLG